MPSGTPFRLGVLLSNTVNSHFKMKQDQLGLFFKRVMRELVIPEWKKEFDEEHIMSMFADEEGFGTLKDIALHVNTNDIILKHLLAGQLPDVAAIQQQVSDHLEKQRYLFVKIPDSFYKDIDFKVKLNITGDDVDIAKKVETLTNLMTVLTQRNPQDPRIDTILKRILSLTGENYDVVAGKAPAQQPQGGQPGQAPMGQPQQIPPPQKFGSAPKPTISPNAMPMRGVVTH